MSHQIPSEETARRLGLFSDQETDHYAELHEGEIWWIKAFDARLDRWRVSRYSEESYNRYKNFSKNKSAA